jgi:hypothetical protein
MIIEEVHELLWTDTCLLRLSCSSRVPVLWKQKPVSKGQTHIALPYHHHHHHQCQTTVMKRASSMAARGMAAVTRVAGNKRAMVRAPGRGDDMETNFCGGERGAQGGKNKVRPKKVTYGIYYLWVLGTLYALNHVDYV